MHRKVPAWFGGEPHGKGPVRQYLAVRLTRYVLEGAGLTVWLVNARQVRNVPGRPKTDLLTELPEVASQVSA